MTEGQRSKLEFHEERTSRCAFWTFASPPTLRSFGAAICSMHQETMASWRLDSLCPIVCGLLVGMKTNRGKAIQTRMAWPGRSFHTGSWGVSVQGFGLGSLLAPGKGRLRHADAYRYTLTHAKTQKETMTKTELETGAVARCTAGRIQALNYPALTVWQVEATIIPRLTGNLRDALEVLNVGCC
jgi:hypothetical protein